MLDRLAEQIATAGIPLASITPNAAQPTNPTLIFRQEATAQQQTDAETIKTNFDWTQATHDAWLRLKQHPLAQALLDRLTEEGMILRALVAVLIDELNILRGQVIGVGQAVWDPANMANATGVTSPNFTITGAQLGDEVQVAAPYTLQGITATAYVSAADTIVVRLQNGTGGAINLGSGTWGVVVRRPTALPARTLTQARNAIASKLDSGNVDT